jgi:isoquinoline 1-oxidoreductase subunit alpha
MGLGNSGEQARKLTRIRAAGAEAVAFGQSRSYSHHSRPPRIFSISQLPDESMPKFFVNGEQVDFRAAPDTPLLWAIRDQLGLTGTKYGCGMALCGACTVHVDGQPTRSCVTPVSSIEGKRVVTIEGVANTSQGRVARAVQAAWVDKDVVQCGYCQSGQVMAAVALLGRNASPSDADIDAAMSGNICRCGTYQRMREAIKSAASSLKKA